MVEVVSLVKVLVFLHCSLTILLFSTLPSLQQEMVHCSVVVGYISNNILLHLSSHYLQICLLLSHTNGLMFTAMVMFTSNPPVFSCGCLEMAMNNFSLNSSDIRLVECQLLSLQSYIQKCFQESCCSNWLPFSCWKEVGYGIKVSSLLGTYNMCIQKFQVILSMFANVKSVQQFSKDFVILLLHYLIQFKNTKMLTLKVCSQWTIVSFQVHEDEVIFNRF